MQTPNHHDVQILKSSHLVLEGQQVNSVIPLRIKINIPEVWYIYYIII